MAEVPTVFDRYQAQHPQCKFGTDGVCCRLCHMGPCRITPKAHLGICGADADTIIARNLLREIAAGTAAHSDHGRMLVRTLKLVAQGKGGDYKIAAPDRLHEAARFFEIAVEGRERSRQLPNDLADFFMAQFAWSEQPNATLRLAPEKRQALWKKLGISPDGHRLRSCGAHASHPHGRGSRLPAPDHGRAEMQPGGWLGRVDHRDHWFPTFSSALPSRSAAE